MDAAGVTGNKTRLASCDVTLTTNAWIGILALAAGCSGSSGKAPASGTGGAGPDEADAAPAATGGSKGTGGSSPADARAADLAPAPDVAEHPDVALAPDTARPDTAPDSGGSDAAAAGAALHNYVFSIECPPGTSDECNVPDARRLKTSAPLSFGGDPAVTYRVRLHFCGPVEGRKYAGCMKATPTSDPLFCMDGTPVPMSGGDQYVDTYPTYEMKVSAPAHSYFVNSRDLRDTLMKIDYSAELEIRGGATITFSTTSREQITFTSRKLTPPITCPGVPGLTQPFNGQFIHVTVLSAEAR
jgi:hypothetical protein